MRNFVVLVKLDVIIVTGGTRINQNKINADRVFFFWGGETVKERVV
jgi:hypothetical protein